MRFTILCFLVVNFQLAIGQVICDASQSSAQFGDYPPGCTMCTSFVLGNNIGYTADDTITYDFPCGKVENSVWYSFFSRDRGPVVISFVTNSCNSGKGIEAAVFDDNLNRISNCISIEPNRKGELILFLPERQQFHIMVDGIDGDECEFGVFNIISAASKKIRVSPYSQSYCIGSEVCFIRDRDFVSEDYQWQIPSGDSIVSGGINDEEICIYFKTEGAKEILLKVETPCFDFDYSSTIDVRSGRSITVESFTADTDTYCLGEVVRFDLDWDNDSVDLVWVIPNTDFQKIDGGKLNDDFFEGRIIKEGVLQINIVPNNVCGLRLEHQMVSSAPSTRVINRFVCQDECFTVGDSCYFFTGSDIEEINVGTTIEGCDSTIQLVLTSADVLPSPQIECAQINDGIELEWEQVSGAEGYIIFANRDSIATVFNTSYFLDNLPIGTSLVIKVQPFGKCSYLPAEINCTDLITNVSSDFVDKKISIYPNPTTGQINIKTDLILESVEVLDLAGRHLQKENSTSFELRNQETGLYFLKIKTSAGVLVKRVLVN